MQCSRPPCAVMSKGGVAVLRLDLLRVNPGLQEQGQPQHVLAVLVSPATEYFDSLLCYFRRRPYSPFGSWPLASLSSFSTLWPLENRLQRCRFGKGSRLECSRAVNNAACWNDTRRRHKSA